MRSINESILRRFRAGERPSIKVLFDGVDYSSDLVDFDTLRLEKILENGKGQLRVPEMMLRFNDPEGQLEQYLATAERKTEVSLELDGTEIPLFKGFVDRSHMQREGVRLSVRAHGYLRKIRETKLKDILGQDVFIEAIRLTLGRILGYAPGEENLIEYNGSNLLLTVDGTLESNFSVRKKPVVTVLETNASTVRVGIALSLGEHCEDTGGGLVCANSVLMGIADIDFSTPLPTFDWVYQYLYQGCLEGKWMGTARDESNYKEYHFALRKSDGGVELWKYHQVTAAQQVATIPLAHGFYYFQSLDLMSLDVETKAYYYVRRMPGGSYPVIYKYDIGTGSESASLEVPPGLGELKRLAGFRSSSDSAIGSDFILCIADEHQAYYMRMSVGTWISISIGARGGLLTGFEDEEGRVWIIGAKDRIRYFSVSDGGLGVSNFSFSGDFSNYNNYTHRAGSKDVFVLSMIQHVDEGYWCFAKSSNLVYPWDTITSQGYQEDRFRVSFAPLYADQNWSVPIIGSVEIIPKENTENRHYAAIQGSFSKQAFRPWCVLIPETLERSVEEFLTFAFKVGFYIVDVKDFDGNNYVADYFYLLSVDEPVMELGQDDYERTPLFSYRPAYWWYTWKSYFSDHEPDPWRSDLLVYDYPFAIFSVLRFAASIYFHNFTTSTADYKFKLAGNITPEVGDIITVTDSLGREQTLRVTGFVYEYPLFYQVIGTTRLNYEITVDEEDDMPAPSPPALDIDVDVSRLYRGPSHNALVTINYRTTGYPCEKIIVNYCINDRTMDDAEASDVERRVFEIDELTGTLSFTIPVRWTTEINGWVYGVDRFGRTTEEVSFNLPAMARDAVPLLEVDRESLNEENQIIKVVDNSGSDVVKDGIIYKGVVVKSLGDGIQNTIGISDIYNPAFDDEDGDNNPDGWSITTSNCSWQLSTDSFMGRNAIQINVGAGESGTAYIKNDAFLPANNQAFNKYVFYGYRVYLSSGLFEVIPYLRIEEYDKDKNLITTQDIQLDDLIDSMSDYQVKSVRVSPTLNNNTRYVKVGLYLDIWSDATNTYGVQVYISYFYIAEQYSANALKISEDFNMLGKKIVNLADPSNSQDAATKSYVDKFVLADVVIEEGDDIADALTSLSGGETVLIKNGTYTINSTINITASGVKIICQPNVLFTGSATPMFSLRNSDIVWDGGIFDGSAGGSGIEVYGTYAGRVIQNTHFTGFASGKYAIILNCSSSHATKILNNKFESCSDYAIHDNNTGYGYLLLVQGNHFRDCYGAISLKYQEIFAIAGNQFYHCGNQPSSKNVIYAYQPRMSAIYGNSFWQSYYTAIRLTGGSGIGNAIFGNVMLATGYPTYDNSGVYDIHVNANTNNSIFGNALRPRNFAEGSIRLDSGCSGTFIGMNAFDCQNQKYIFYNETDARIVESVETGTSLPTQYLYEGKMFYNTSDNKLYVRVGGVWKSVQLS